MRGMSTGFAVVMQKWAESRHIPLVPSEAQKAKTNYSVNERVRDYRWLFGRFPRRKDRNIAGR